jgi:hypothetical protein
MGRTVPTFTNIIDGPLGKEVSRRDAKSAKVAERAVRLQPIDNSHKPVPQQWDIEVDEKAQTETGKTEVG